MQAFLKEGISDEEEAAEKLSLTNSVRPELNQIYFDAVPRFLIIIFCFKVLGLSIIGFRFN